MGVIYCHYHLIACLQVHIAINGKLALRQQFGQRGGGAGGFLSTASATAGLQAFDPDLTFGNPGNNRLFFYHGADLLPGRADGVQPVA